MFRICFILSLLLTLSNTSCAIDLIVNGGTATLYGTKTYETVNLTNGAILYVTDHSDSGGGRLRIEAVRVYVDSTSRIVGTGRGYSGGQGASLCVYNPGEDGEDSYGGPAKDRADRTGAGEGAYGTGSKVEGAGGGGAGYGGAGGMGGNERGNAAVPGLGGSVYGYADSYDARMGAGGGGGSASCFKAAGGGKGGDGGAVLEIIATHSVTIKGSVEFLGQRGDNGIEYQAGSGGGGGGGAGGGVFIATPRLNFSGTIDVSGGAGGSGGGAGGGGGGGAGGRVKLVGCELAVSGTSLFSGGLPGPSAGVAAVAGGNGTYLEVIDCYTYSLLPPHLKTFKVTNMRADTANVALSVIGSEVAGWVTLDPTYVSIPAFGSEIVTVGVYPPFYLPKGYYYGQILVNSSGADAVYVDLSIWVKRRESLSLSPGSWTASVGGGWKESKILSICNTGDTTMYGVTLSTEGVADWIIFPGGKMLGDLYPADCIDREAILVVPENASFGPYNGTINVLSGTSANATLDVNVTLKDCGDWCVYSKYAGGSCREDASRCYAYGEGYNIYGSEQYCGEYEPANEACCCYMSCVEACGFEGYADWACTANCSLGWYGVSKGNSYCVEHGDASCCCSA